MVQASVNLSNSADVPTKSASIGDPRHPWQEQLSNIMHATVDAIVGETGASGVIEENVQMKVTIAGLQQQLGSLMAERSEYLEANRRYSEWQKEITVQRNEWVADRAALEQLRAEHQQQLRISSNKSKEHDKQIKALQAKEAQLLASNGQLQSELAYANSMLNRVMSQNPGFRPRLSSASAPSSPVYIEAGNYNLNNQATQQMISPTYSAGERGQHMKPHPQHMPMQSTPLDSKPHPQSFHPYRQANRQSVSFRAGPSPPIAPIPGLRSVSQPGPSVRRKSSGGPVTSSSGHSQIEVIDLTVSNGPPLQATNGINTMTHPHTSASTEFAGATQQFAMRAPLHQPRIQIPPHHPTAPGPDTIPPPTPAPDVAPPNVETVVEDVKIPPAFMIPPKVEADPDVRGRLQEFLKLLFVPPPGSAASQAGSESFICNLCQRREKDKEGGPTLYSSELNVLLEHVKSAHKKPYKFAREGPQQ
ncbi:hypothetical protein BOTBODRAFT_32352 [Botryobasidium botryosum FD-172 SS1]|uniref:Uncharacterized protein n=1 Tax=Botryobasidium botryosum (strain FD-172 SS1) TaxID=930990 RepID=A0A067MRV2_BOTB1|nr:hypothetical protein BOTBODRAFT_32352 [Botryobasidium botryosum FD-172 SS1]